MRLCAGLYMLHAAMHRKGTTGKVTMASCAFNADYSGSRFSVPPGVMLMPAPDLRSQVSCSAAATAELPPNLKKIVGAFQMVSPLQTRQNFTQPGPDAVCELAFRAQLLAALPLSGWHQGHPGHSQSL